MSDHPPAQPSLIGDSFDEFLATYDTSLSMNVLQQFLRDERPLGPRLPIVQYILQNNTRIDVNDETFTRVIQTSYRIRNRPDAIAEIRRLQHEFTSQELETTNDNFITLRDNNKADATNPTQQGAKQRIGGQAVGSLLPTTSPAEHIVTNKKEITFLPPQIAYETAKTTCDFNDVSIHEKLRIKDDIIVHLSQQLQKYSTPEQYKAYMSKLFDNCFDGTGLQFQPYSNRRGGRLQAEIEANAVKNFVEKNKDDIAPHLVLEVLGGPEDPINEQVEDGIVGGQQQHNNNNKEPQLAVPTDGLTHNPSTTTDTPTTLTAAPSHVDQQEKHDQQQKEQQHAEHNHEQQQAQSEGEECHPTSPTTSPTHTAAKPQNEPHPLPTTTSTVTKHKGPSLVINRTRPYLSALHYLCANPQYIPDRYQIAEFLLSRGASPNGYRDNHITPVYDILINPGFTTFDDRITFLRLFLKHKAILCEPDANKNSLLHLVVALPIYTMHQKKSLIDILTQYGANVNAVNQHGHTALELLIWGYNSLIPAVSSMFLPDLTKITHTPEGGYTTVSRVSPQPPQQHPERILEKPAEATTTKTKPTTKTTQGTTTTTTTAPTTTTAANTTTTPQAGATTTATSTTATTTTTPASTTQATPTPPIAEPTPTPVVPTTITSTTMYMQTVAERVQLCQALYDHNSSVKGGTRGTTLLNKLCSTYTPHRTTFLRLLLQNNTPVDDTDNSGETALHCIVTNENNRIEVIKLLLEKSTNYESAIKQQDRVAEQHKAHFPFQNAISIVNSYHKNAAQRAGLNVKKGAVDLLYHVFHTQNTAHIEEGYELNKKLLAKHEKDKITQFLYADYPTFDAVLQESQIYDVNDGLEVAQLLLEQGHASPFVLSKSEHFALDHHYFILRGVLALSPQFQEEYGRLQTVENEGTDLNKSSLPLELPFTNWIHKQNQLLKKESAKSRRRASGHHLKKKRNKDGDRDGSSESEDDDDDYELSSYTSEEEEEEDDQDDYSNTHDANNDSNRNTAHHDHPSTSSYLDRTGSKLHRPHYRTTTTNTDNANATEDGVSITRYHQQQPNMRDFANEMPIVRSRDVQLQQLQPVAYEPGYAPDAPHRSNEKITAVAQKMGFQMPTSDLPVMKSGSTAGVLSPQAGGRLIGQQQAQQQQAQQQTGGPNPAPTVLPPQSLSAQSSGDLKADQ